MTDVKEKLIKAGLSPTQQRLIIGRYVLVDSGHFTADKVLEMVKEDGFNVSRATVYNTLSVFVERGLLNEVIIEQGKVLYDANTNPHYYMVDSKTGEIQDVDPDDVTLTNLPQVVNGKPIADVHIVFKV
ncbi:MAG: Fur family transcriptional regulator [Arenicella sp.]